MNKVNVVEEEGGDHSLLGTKAQPKNVGIHQDDGVDRRAVFASRSS